MSPARGALLDVVVEKGVYRGLGLARHEGQVLFVPRGLPGDRLRVRVEEVRAGYMSAALIEVTQPGPERRPSPCPYVPRCGGCAYQELAYPAQLQLKEEVLRETLARSGVAWNGPLAVTPSPEGSWRTRCEFHLDAAPDGALRLGLREEGRRRVVDVESCLQLSEPMNRALRGLLAGLRTRPGLARRVRDVELAESPDGSHLVACLDTTLAPGEAAGLSFLAGQVPWLTGLGAVAGHAARRRFVNLAGEPFVWAEAGGLRLRSHVRSFFQANRFLLSPLVEHVGRSLPEGGTLLDLYCGVGLFALPLAARYESVLAAELNPSAVDDACANAQAAGLGHVRVEQADVRQALARWPAVVGERIVLDPPRTGAGREVVAAIAARAPEAIVYVSCDPPTLGRDLRALAAVGYHPAALAAFDLFPDTFHLETVVELRRT